MRHSLIAVVVFCVVLCATVSAAEPATITVKVRRTIPEGITRPAGFPEQSEHVIPLKSTGCEGVAELKSIDHRLAVEVQGETIIVRSVAEPVIEKLAKGPLFPPSVIIAQKNKSAASVTLVMESSMASDGWEAGGTFREASESSKLTDAKFWESIELRCSAESPYHAAVVPDDVTYVRMPDDALAAKVARISALLRGTKGFGASELYDDVVLIGPGLFLGLESDPAIGKVESPKVVTIDPVTKNSRRMLRIKGHAEHALFGQAMRRYLGDAPLRIRAATAAELAELWLNIGWDIEEPLLIAQYGKHRLVLDVDKDHVMMVDELHK